MDSMPDFAGVAIDLSKVDWRGLEASLGGIAHEVLIPVVEGEAGDLKEFALGVGRDMVNAIMTRKLDWQARHRAQLSALEELGRIRTNRASWSFAEQALGLVFRAVVAGIGASIPKP